LLEGVVAPQHDAAFTSFSCRAILLYFSRTISLSFCSVFMISILTAIACGGVLILIE